MIDKSIMIIPGGEFQIPIIKKAKELGFKVIVTDKNKDAAGFLYADFYKCIDTCDRDLLLKYVQEVKPNGIITDQTDMAVNTVAYLNEKNSSNGISVEKANLFTNKYLMRDFCNKNGFNYPQYKLCSDIDEVKDFCNKVGFPIILKPLTNQSSKGVNKVNSEDEIIVKYKDTFNFSNNKKVLAEKYIDGIEYTVEGFKTKEKHISLAVSEKKHFKNNEMVACKLLYLNTDNNVKFDRLKDINNSLIEKMQLPFGITHAEYKHCNGEFYLIEIAARGGGTKISSDIIHRMSGVDVNELLIKYALNAEFDKDIVIEKNETFMILEFFDIKCGKVKDISGIQAIKAMNNVIELKLNFAIGEYVGNPEDDSKRAGYYIAVGKDLQEIDEISNNIKNSLVICYE